MDDEEFRKRLSEVAVWEIPKTPRETSLNNKKKRGRKSNEELYQELREEIFLEEFDGTNPTYPPMLVKLKCQPTTCEDCGEHCPSGRQKETKLYEANNKRHWRERCVTCSRTKNPYTGQFDLTNATASHIWNAWIRELKQPKKMVYKKKEVEEQQPSSVIENEHETITYYHENKTET